MSQCVPGTDYSKLLPPSVRTRSSSDICSCFLCNKGRETLTPFQVSHTAKDPPVKSCTSCHGEIAPGVSHICTRSERNTNIVDLVRSVSERSRGQIVSQALKGQYINIGPESILMTSRPKRIIWGFQPDNPPDKGYPPSYNNRKTSR